jgi:NADH:ubiquinone oxidoreductase subunit K
MSVGINLILIASAALFAVGLFAIVARRSAITTLLGTQFVFAAGAIAFVAFGRFGLGRADQNAGAAMALFAGATALAELAIGLAMAFVIYRESHSFVLDPDRG